MKHTLSILFFFVFVIVNTIDISAQTTDTLQYMFVGHTYQCHTVGDKVDKRLEKMNLSSYSGIWLGGDVCSEALLNYSTLSYIDGLFNLSHPNTHWALGNHDTRNGNWIWLEELTGHKTYYNSYYKGISYIVLNTNLTPHHCEQLNDQYRIISETCDTITESSHLIILAHHGLWNDVPGINQKAFWRTNSNLVYYNFNCDTIGSTFINAVYPKLVDVKKRGIEVICIMGDLDAYTFENISNDGIHFLGTGLNRSYFTDPIERANSPVDYALIFHHIPSKKELSWQFVDFDVLSGYTP